MKNKSIFIFFSLFTIIVSLSGCKEERFQRSEGMVWNTVYHITYKGAPLFEDSVLNVMSQVSESLNVFDSTSLVSQLNLYEKIKADQNLITVYSASKKINSISNRKFDPTLSPLITAWGFGLGHKPTADTLAIDSILRFVGIEKTRLEGDTIYKDDIRTRFNFSAIAKGYGCDAIGEMFKRNGINDFMVEIGGEVSLSGKSPSGRLWKIAIDAPKEDMDPGTESALVIELTDAGIATSGNYRNFRDENGKKLAHTISVETGRPYLSEILSATVVAKDCMTADGLATACMASTVEEARRILEECEAEGLLIFNDSVWMTPGFKKFIVE